MEDRSKLVKIFLEKNSQINLSAIRDEEGVRVKHIQDSLELLAFSDLEEGSKVCDVGTGSGFPLLPLAMTNPAVSFIGVDSVKKKTIAINEIIAQLGLKNVKVLWTRAEDYKTQFDIVTARAVAYVDKLLPWIVHLVKTGGLIILYKPFSLDERKDLLTLCKRFRLRIEKEHKYSLFDGDIKRVIYVIRK